MWRARTVDCESSRHNKRGPEPEGNLRLSANPIRELFDAAAQGYSLTFQCRGCGRRQTFNAAAVWRHFESRSWSPWLRDVPRRFRCRVCEQASPRLQLGHEYPTDTSLPLPDPYAWKRALSRRR